MDGFRRRVPLFGALFLAAACNSGGLRTKKADGGTDSIRASGGASATGGIPSGTGGSGGSGAGGGVDAVSARDAAADGADVARDARSDAAADGADVAKDARSDGAAERSTIDGGPAEKDVALESVSRDAGGDSSSNESGGAPILGSAPIPTTGRYPISVAAIDFDGDGNLDLVTANRDASSISVLLGTGGGRFAARVDYTVASKPYSVAVGDLDADGKPDVVTANREGGSISVFLGKGDGTLGPRVDYPAGAGPNAVAMADLNRDGRMDVAVVNLTYGDQGGATVSVLLAATGGKLADRVSYPTGAFPEAIAIADMNTDQTADLVIASWDGTVSVLAGRGDGTFAAKLDSNAGTFAYALAVGDFNRDGKLDVVSANADSNSKGASVSLATGGGQLDTKRDYETGYHAASDSPTYYYGRVGNSPNSIAVADLNGDGNPDIVEADSQSPGVSVLLGKGGNGDFAARAAYQTGGASLSLVLADINGDRKLDLVATNADTDTVAVMPGQGDGTFADTIARVEYPIEDHATAGALSDLNGDGKVDLVVASAADSAAPGKVSVLLGTGTGGFAAAVPYPTGNGPRQVAVGDVNSDNQPDVVVANLDASTVSVLLGAGTGELAAKVDYPTGAGPNSLALGDLDGDGTVDVVTGNRSDPYTVSVLLGTGGGRFAAKVDYSLGHFPVAVKVVDVNGDGRPDLVTVGDAAVGVMLGKDDRKLAAPVDYPIDSASAAAFGDVDGDHILDVVLTSFGMQVVEALTGRGDGTLGRQVDSLLGYSSNAIALADMNRDGKLDIVTASSASDTVSVLLGNNDGNFAARFDYATGSGPATWMAAGDVNGDGRTDLVLTAYSPSAVSVLLNTAP